MYFFTNQWPFCFPPETNKFQHLQLIFNIDANSRINPPYFWCLGPFVRLVVPALLTLLLSLQQNPADGSWEDPALEKLHLFCEESRRLNDWVPEISLPERWTGSLPLTWSVHPWKSSSRPGWFRFRFFPGRSWGASMPGLAWRRQRRRPPQPSVPRWAWFFLRTRSGTQRGAAHRRPSFFVRMRFGEGGEEASSASRGSHGANVAT